MSLGENRDYKTHERRVSKNLKKHYELMNALIAQGMDRETASKQALAQLMKQRKQKRVA